MLNVLNVLNMLNVLDDLNVLKMPKDPSLAYWALFYRNFPFPISTTFALLSRRVGLETYNLAKSGFEAAITKAKHNTRCSFIFFRPNLFLSIWGSIAPLLRHSCATLEGTVITRLIQVLRYISWSTFPFLDASSTPRISKRGLVRPLVHLSIRWSVRNAFVNHDEIIMFTDSEWNKQCLVSLTCN